MLALFAACAPEPPLDDLSSSSRPDLDVVRVAAPPFLATLPLHVGLVEGIFERHGLQLELVPLRRNMDALPSLISGGLDVGIGQPTVGVLRAIGNGARLRLVADSGHAGPGCANVAFVTRPDVLESGRLGHRAGFAELTVETDLALPQAYWLDLAVRSLGFTLDDLDPVNLPLPTVIEGLQSGRIDLASLSEPNLTRALSGGRLATWQDVADLAPGFQFSAVLFGPSLLDRRTDVGRRFLDAWQEASHLAGETPTEDHLAAMAAATGEVLRRACWPKRSRDGRIEPRGLLDYQSWARRRGLLATELRAEDMIDHDLLAEEASRGNGPLTPRNVEPIAHDAAAGTEP